MEKIIHVVTTDRANYPDLGSENLSMVQALRDCGFSAVLTSWHDLYDRLAENRPFEDILLIRTVWDYPDYAEKFRRFLAMVKERRITTVNPVDVVEWNMNKLYLQDLQDAGLPIVPCEFFSAGSTVPARTVKSVVKPMVGLGASGARILEVGESVCLTADSIVNPFRNSIHNGELSVVMISGKPELFIRKKPSPTDWRVQPQYGGAYLFSDEAPEAAIQVCRKLYRYMQSRFPSEYLLFMRVDLLQNDDDQSWEILEFEAIDPSFYGSVSPNAVNALSRSLRDVTEKAQS